MKSTLALLLAGLMISSVPLVAQQGSLLTQAQKAYLAGDLETAKPLFQQVLAADPQNIAARNYLKAIAQAEAQANPGAAMEKQLQGLILPKVEFREATLDSALDALKQLAIKTSGGKIQPNFVIDPAVNKSAQVTLNLTNIPFREALRYVAGMTGTKIEVDRYAITVKPMPNAPQAAPAQ